MKTLRCVLVLLMIVSMAWMAAAQKNEKESVPKYDKSTEAMFKGDG